MTTELAQIFKALADETRFNLLNLLLTHDWCVGALARRLDVTEAAVSQHLKTLRAAGLVRGEKRGYWTHYTVERGRLRELAGRISALDELPPNSEGLCFKYPERSHNREKEELKMCDCKCQHPEKLKGKTEECTPQQIKECHGDESGHACEDRKETRK